MVEVFCWTVSMAYSTTAYAAARHFRIGIVRFEFESNLEAYNNA